MQQKTVLEFRKQDGTVVLTSSDVKNAAVNGEPTQAVYTIALEFTESGSKILYDVTKELSQKADGENRLEIAVDGEAVAAPAVIAPIENGKAAISMAGKWEAEDILKIIISGMYPSFTPDR